MGLKRRNARDRPDLEGRRGFSKCQLLRKKCYFGIGRVTVVLQGHRQRTITALRHRHRASGILNFSGGFRAGFCWGLFGWSVGVVVVAFPIYLIKWI